MIFKFQKLDAGRLLLCSAGLVKIEAEHGARIGADEAAALAIGMMGRCAGVVDLNGTGAIWIAFQEPELLRKFLSS